MRKTPFYYCKKALPLTKLNIWFIEKDENMNVENAYFRWHVFIHTLNLFRRCKIIIKVRVETNYRIFSFCLRNCSQKH